MRRVKEYHFQQTKEGRKRPLTGVSRMEARKTSTSSFRMDVTKLPPQLQQGHTLKSINENVLRRYEDRAAKLPFHLPFAEVPKPDFGKSGSRDASFMRQSFEG